MKLNQIFSIMLVGVLSTMVLSSCSVKIPKGAKAVQDFNSDKYLGKWYEIARLDHSFERNMNNVTATYSKNEDNSIKVENRGYNTRKNQWKAITGKAKFVHSSSEGRLKVSFFGPFYSGYNIIDLVDYRYALIAGNNLNYLWILSREPKVSEEIKNRFLEKAKNIGYDTKQLIWVEHSK